MLIRVLWRASQFLEINLFLEKKSPHIREVSPSIVRETLEMTLLKVGLIKLGDDEPQEEDMIAAIPKKLGSTTARCEELIV
jgi:hypothetical protein